jgi:hypothetical protein
MVSYFTLRFLPQSDLTLAAAMAGIGAFYIGSALMPLMFGQTARSHLINVLPNGRLKLLASAFITVAIVSLPTPILWAFAYLAAALGKNPDAAHVATVHQATIQIFWMIYTSAFLIAGWLYVAMWLITSQRSVSGFLRGMLVLMLLLYAPTKHIQSLDTSVKWNLTQGALAWALFACSFLWWPQWRVFTSRFRRKLWPARPPRLRQQVAGHELDLLLGTSNPWVLAVAQAAPVIIAARLISLSPSVWLFYLTIFSTASGAIAGQAAERSRSLWLRASWSRAELFTHVEQSFWRHNSYALGILLVLMVAIGSYANLSASLLSVGLPLLALGTALSTYLGLMITRGLKWLESTLAIGVMLILMTATVIAARSDDNLTPVIALELSLAGLVLALRAVAKRRWTDIDWTECRPDRIANGRYTS